MRRIISVLISTVMFLSALPVSASTPENLIENYLVKEKKVSKKIESSKCETSVVSVTVDGDKNTSFGEGIALFDGAGMIDGSSILDGDLVSGTGMQNEQRWMAKDATVLPKFNVEFENAVTFNCINYTEARKLISEYKITCYKGAEEILEETGVFSDYTGDNRVYIRSIPLSKEITADRIVFEVTARSSTFSNGISITEMELWKDSGINVSCDTADYSESGGISKVLDGENMSFSKDAITAPALEDRWAVGGGTTPEITIDLRDDIIFDSIKFTEVRKQIEGYSVICYRDDELVFSKNGTLEDGSSSLTSASAYLREIKLGEEINADKIIFKITSTSGNSVISISELELWNSGYAPSIKNSEGEFLTVTSGEVFDGFDSDISTSFTTDVSSVSELTLEFSLTELVVADCLKIKADEIESLSLYGSIDKENYFEISAVVSDDKHLFDFPEILCAVKAEIVLPDSVAEFEVFEIELLKAVTDSDYDDLKALFLEESTNLITQECLTSITQNINNPLPNAFGSYTVEWDSSDSSIVDVETGVVTKSYIKKTVEISTKFIRDGVTYKENTYTLTVEDDGSLSEKSKYVLSSEIDNLSSKIISSDIRDYYGYDPTNTAAEFSGAAALYDESSKTENFTTDNLNSWGAFTYADATTKYSLPYTFQFDFSETTVINGFDLWEYRDRINTIDVMFSTDGVTWSAVAENVNVSNGGTNDNRLEKKEVRFPVIYAKHVRVVIKELRETTSGVATKICEIVFLNEQGLPSLDGADDINVADKDENTYSEIIQSGSLIIDLGKIQGFDNIKWLNSGEKAENYSVYISNSAADWKKVKEGTLANSYEELTEIDLEDYFLARFIKIDIESVYSDEPVKICELYVMEESADELYVEKKKLAGLVSQNKTDILTTENLKAITLDYLENIPQSVDFYTLIWDFSQATMINPETKAVTHTDEDVEGVIKVSVTDSDMGVNIYNGEFPIIAKAVFDESDYYIASQKDILSTSYDFDRPVGFLFNQSDTVIEFKVTASNEGKIEIESDNEIVNIDVAEDEIKFNCRNCTETVKMNTEAEIRIVLNKSSFDLYVNSDDSGYKGVIGGGTYLNENTNGIKLITATMPVYGIKLLISKEYLKDFLDQLDFSHLSDEGMYEVTRSISLFDEIIGLPISWTSSNSEAININTGAVNTSVEPSSVALTASISVSGVVEWSKNLYTTVNMSNLISNANITTNTTAYMGNTLANATDAQQSTSFKTSYKNGYNIKIIYPANILISQLVLIEDTSQGSVEDFDIYVDDVLVYDGGKINGFTHCLLDPLYGREIKIDIKSTTDITGFKEISVCSDLSDMQKVVNDLKEVSISNSYTNGTYYLPKNGTHGSVFTYSCDEASVKFTENAENITMNVNNTDYDVSAVITVNAEFNGNMKTKSSSSIIKGTKTVGYTPPSSSGGGSSGGGSYAPSGTVSKAENITAPKDELTGHWAESEIRGLVNLGVVKGNGTTLNLKGKVTRAEFLTMLTRVFDVEYSSSPCVFIDVKDDDWYASVIQSAYENGWIDGYNNCAFPDSYITREEMVKIICTALDIVPFENNADMEFSDTDSQSAWAMGYISALSSKNIITGYEDGTFKPKNNLYRDEAMIVIYRIINMEVE